jgi:PPP family 3-phenylpropionic acid transporter
MRHSIPLTLFWLVYMASVGIFYPYFSLYLKENAALSGAELGCALAALPLIGLLAQPFWGYVADRTGARGQIVGILCAGCVIGYLWLGRAAGFDLILLATATLAIFTTAVIPITISVSLAVLRNAGPHGFGFVRVWGTVGYFLSIIAFPMILARYQTAHGLVRGIGGVSEPGLEAMFVVSAGLVLVAALIGLFLPRSGAVGLRAQRGDWKSLLYDPAYRRFLIFSFGAYLLSNGPMWLFPIFVRSRGGDAEAIRTMWVYMLIIEIPLVLASGSGLKRLGSRGLLAVGVSVGGLRWLLCALVNDLQTLSFIQVLHGVTVVGLLMGGPLYLEVIAPEKLRSTAQSFLSMVGVGVAGIVSNFGSGWLLDRVGIDVLYAATGLASIILGALTVFVLPAAENENTTGATCAAAE